MHGVNWCGSFPSPAVPTLGINAHPASLLDQAQGPCRHPGLPRDARVPPMALFLSFICLYVPSINPGRSALCLRPAAAAAPRRGATRRLREGEGTGAWICVGTNTAV